MSTSHHDVGIAFGKRKVAKGSRMHTEIVGHTRSPLFTVVTRGISYSTCVAAVVVNHHTKLSELWLTPDKYSSSTQRHKDYYRHGFIEAYIANHGCSREDAHRQIFMTRAVDTPYTYADRCTATQGQATLVSVHAFLAEVNAPRLRDATRRGHLAAALFRVEDAVDRMTRAVPADYPDAQTLYELQDMAAFLNNTLDLTSVDDMRVAVRAWLTLNDPKNN